MRLKVALAMTGELLTVESDAGMNASGGGGGRVSSLVLSVPDEEDK